MKRVVRRRVKKTPLAKTVPDTILNNPEIGSAISSLPPAYSFEIHKTIHRLLTAKSKFCALQMPEGLLMYGCVISDIIKRFTSVTAVVLLGDVTYGACCVDDLGAEALGCDFLVHYGHSCLVPMTCTVLPTLYVFVEIAIDVTHAIKCMRETVPEKSKINIMGTVQFSAAVQQAKQVRSEARRASSGSEARRASEGIARSAPAIQSAPLLGHCVCDASEPAIQSAPLLGLCMCVTQPNLPNVISPTLTVFFSRTFLLSATTAWYRRPNLFPPVKFLAAPVPRTCSTTALTRPTSACCSSRTAGFTWRPL